ncbi:hypothetical protein GLOTRDRAFT_71540 [Gloeophyllum trabeum ATCC 11539]|uniref:J domain-containing protein n=1 Tax=Gloeophyllum trabeum (strain ATCC 11539 / FP-39264 / Madison 617) TaxID=670483 RepID=S7QJI7_GLOTA|nr:uncharacterized protein GLOTRDRAFT_71540 [Gloeophyllum trabeum ATCC 11539]EPQ59851.1 hypothetical protein GLOTRDRAFT_71540 [Gloeophyllum trabeum ATCC 11539]
MVLFTKLAALVLLAFPHAILADPSSGSALYPPGLLPLINRANTLFSAGQFNEASRIYSEAIEQSPLDYLLYYRRATAYLSLSRYPQALSDLDKVLELTNNTFDKAHLVKARIHALSGHWAEARASLAQYGKAKKASDPEAMEIMMSVSEGESAEKKARQAAKSHLWTLCEEESSIALRTATHSVDLRQLRVQCSLQAGDVESAVGDLTRITHLTSASTPLYMRIFRLTYFLLPPTSTESALSTLKQCLHYDPDSKPCFSARRLVKTLAKSTDKLSSYEADSKWYGLINLLVPKKSTGKGGLISEFEEAVKEHFEKEELPSSLQPMKSSPRLAELYRSACRAYTKLGKAKEGETYCASLLGMKGMEDDAIGLVGRGEALLVKEEWEEAVRVLEKAFEATGRSDREVMQSLQKAQKLLKQSKQKDYYKVLGVARDADQKTIKKAYRKATMKAHPDKGGSEAKMAAVNEAYEVLSNPELRARFDAGDDPNDPMSQQGGHPFQQGGSPFGFHPGGGAQFAFSEGHPFAEFFGGGPGGFQFQFGRSGGRGRRGH